MSEEKAGYGPEESPVDREARRFGWLHNKPDGSVCSTEDAEGVRWDPRRQEVRCFECGMVFHAGISVAGDLIASVKRIFEDAYEQVKSSNRRLTWKSQDQERAFRILLAHLLEDYGKPFTLPTVCLESPDPHLMLHWTNEHAMLGRTYWVERITADTKVDLKRQEINLPALLAPAHEEIEEATSPNLIKVTAHWSCSVHGVPQTPQDYLICRRTHGGQMRFDAHFRTSPSEEEIAAAQIAMGYHPAGYSGLWRTSIEERAGEFVAIWFCSESCD